ncbi:uncharacterized protein I206_104457 [Kwoniella pini CBS 10737]|uniref:TPR domain-containing protein n=1 Tax=Kwoniella pini CBS 10737 TaxID=1296096 RepID=A0A1B9I1W3_9TREE|nr:TPR domain-containing protein [Kwoniella pini CBS 10737]OCF49441.1 TPR domain-containing protein [Kwoniella pini CBS 10737]
MTVTLENIPSPSNGPYPYKLGTYSRSIQTASRECQVWFDRGLLWSYGFHHEEAARCFRRALDLDPGCAMAYWGIAYAAGPNYNRPWKMFNEEELKRLLTKCHSAGSKALEYATDSLEIALAQAILARYPLDEQGNPTAWNLAYSDRMAEVYQEFGDDLDVIALYADSLMAIAPWQLWDLQTGAPREDSRTSQIQSVLEKALRNPSSNTHPGILHMYIHLMELSPTPERAIPAADHLRGLCPDSGHLNHMPGHIDLLIGDYRRAISTNLQAIKGDEKNNYEGATTEFYYLYRLHNYAFVIYAAMLNGQFSIAQETLDKLETHLTDDLYRRIDPPLINFIEGSKSYRVHLLVRFGKWQDILNLPFPDDREFYCVTTTILHYARGVAFSVLGDLDNASKEQSLFRQSRKKVPSTRYNFRNSWQDILNIAETMLGGELEYRRGNYEHAFEQLRQSIYYCDNMIYSEPWAWMQPPRHAYAALQLEQGNLEEAAKVYAEDLGFSDTLPRAVRHLNNVWALHGYHECLKRLGRTQEARMIEPQLGLALAVADVPIESSCFCRRISSPPDEAGYC